MFYVVLSTILLAAGLVFALWDGNDGPYDKSERTSKAKGRKDARTFSHTQGPAPSPARPKVAPAPQPAPKPKAPSPWEPTPQSRPSSSPLSGSGAPSPWEPTPQSRPSSSPLSGSGLDFHGGQPRSGGSTPFPDFTSASVPDPFPAPAMQEDGWSDPIFPDVECEWEDLSFLEDIDYYEELADDAESFPVAGLGYHCTYLDRGPIVGTVRPEPDNPSDGRAQAVIRNDGKLLGYIPRSMLDLYEGFNPQNVVCPFTGNIMGDKGRLRARIKVIIPTDRQTVRDEMQFTL